MVVLETHPASGRLVAPGNVELVERTSSWERKMAFRSDWKSADQLQADIDAGSITPAHHLIIDLWRRVEELQAHIVELERQMKEKNLN